MTLKAGIFPLASLTDGQPLLQLLQWGSSQQKVPKGYDERPEPAIQTWSKAPVSKLARYRQHYQTLKPDFHKQECDSELTIIRMQCLRHADPNSRTIKGPFTGLGSSSHNWGSKVAFLRFFFFFNDSLRLTARLDQVREHQIPSFQKSRQGTPWWKC